MKNCLEDWSQSNQPTHREEEPVQDANRQIIKENASPLFSSTRWLQNYKGH